MQHTLKKMRTCPLMEFPTKVEKCLKKVKHQEKLWVYLVIVASRVCCQCMAN